jgi:hypothetical protein
MHNNGDHLNSYHFHITPNILFWPVSVNMVLLSVDSNLVCDIYVVIVMCTNRIDNITSEVQSLRTLPVASAFKPIEACSSFK